MNSFFCHLLPENHSSRSYWLTGKRKINLLPLSQQPNTRTLIGGQCWASPMEVEGREQGRPPPNSISSKMRRSAPASFPDLPRTVQTLLGSWLWRRGRENGGSLHLLSEAREFLPSRVHPTLCFLLWKISNFNSLQIWMEDFFPFLFKWQSWLNT